LIDRLGGCFREIRRGLGAHKTPAEYGAFPFDPYSHTPGFAGVQQPGLTGQVKEDVISRFWQLGVRVREGELRFEPLMLERAEFLPQPVQWALGPKRIEPLPAGSLAFTLCGVPVIYRLADAARVRVYDERGEDRRIDGAGLDRELTRSLFRREGRIHKLVVDLPERLLR
jgi:hypothetical protein